MKVHLKRSGGVMGITREWNIDSSQISSEAYLQLDTFLQAAQFFSLPNEIKSSHQTCDEFFYDIAIERQGKKHKVCCSDSDMPPPLRRCVQWILNNLLS